MHDWTEILSSVNHKDVEGVRSATSKKFKLDLIDFFEPKNSKDWRIIEVGSYCGDTTVILANLFKQVDAIEISPVKIKIAEQKTKKYKNVFFHNMDAYKNDWPVTDYEVAFIDCVHTTSAVIQDINNAKKYSSKLKYIIFDDYGAHSQVRTAIDSVEWKNMIDIGYSDFLPNIGNITGSEGLICEVLYEN